MEKNNNGIDKAKSNPISKRKIARIKKRNKFLFFFLIFSMIGIISFYLATTDFFLITKVDVSGTNKYTKQEIKDFANIEIGSNLFKINRKKLREDLIENYVYIEDVDIKINFPPSIIIDIKQAEPFALIKEDIEYLIVSENGRVLERVSNPVNTKMPVVMGITNSMNFSENAANNSAEKSETENLLGADATKINNALINQNAIRVGDNISKENNETLAMLGKLTEAMEKTEFLGVTKIDVSDRFNIKIVYEDRLLILLGSGDELEYKLNFIKLTEAYNEESGFEGVIDATIQRQLRVREMDIDKIIINDFEYDNAILDIGQGNDENSIDEAISSEIQSAEEQTASSSSEENSSSETEN